MKTIAIIPSGGIGKRINSSLPKQYISVNGKELISYTLNVFQQCNLVNEIVVAAQPDYFELLENIKQRDKILKLTNVV
ncbi:MAG: 2-C-methyl-D-erythritol 4-phosphate cytidylyltransferase, partial [Melioribacteraceae bacterium]|nr:2-C-methyl-D-erythritol 4-phosphate cytidylyltransferase [Melioribacteraceae bacterium]